MRLKPVPGALSPRAQGTHSIQCIPPLSLSPLSLDQQGLLSELFKRPQEDASLGSGYTQEAWRDWVVHVTGLETLFAQTGVSGSP